MLGCSVPKHCAIHDERRSGGNTAHFLNYGIRWRWVVRFTVLLLYHRGKSLKFSSTIQRNWVWSKQLFILTQHTTCLVSQKGPVHWGFHSWEENHMIVTLGGRFTPSTGLFILGCFKLSLSVLRIHIRYLNAICDTYRRLRSLLSRFPRLCSSYVISART
jgi:hypothetical protein